MISSLLSRDVVEAGCALLFWSVYFGPGAQVVRFHEGAPQHVDGGVGRVDLTTDEIRLLFMYAQQCILQVTERTAHIILVCSLQNTANKILIVMYDFSYNIKD